MLYIFYIIQEQKKITVLHTNTEYPTPMEDVDLRAMVKMGNELHIKFGYSDHTLGTEAVYQQLQWEQVA